MEGIKQHTGLPKNVKKRLQAVLLLFCAVITFVIPVFGGGYTVLKEPPVTSRATPIEDIDLPLVAASAFGEARKVMNATDNDAKDTFVNNTAQIIRSKWQNMGLLIGARDALSGSTWGSYQSPITLSGSEVATYGDADLAEAYNKYKAFGYAVQNLNTSAKKSKATAVSVEEGLDSMSTAAIKLGGFGVQFLNDYNPGPILLSLYNSRYLTTYSANKLVQIVINNDTLNNIVHLFGDPIVAAGNLSFFVIINAVIAVIGFALSLLVTLFGNRTIGDGLKKFLVRVVIGTIGVFVIANLMSQLLNWTTATTSTVTTSAESRYVEENLNLYDWYLTGFALPARDADGNQLVLSVDANGQFMFTPAIVRAINEYTYGRLYGTPDDLAMKTKMETYTHYSNDGLASFVTPSMVGADGAEAWATDKYYAIMKNYAENKENLLDDGGDESSPLHGQTGMVLYKCRYLWMSTLRLERNGDGWDATGTGGSTMYGLNPISAFNMIRSDFSGDSIVATSTVYPSIAYVAFDVVRGYTASASRNMDAITRFIACFTLVLAALKGLITIFTAGFAGLLSGGIKTAMGSSHGLGQAIGAVIALLLGIVGISVIMSMTLSLLDTVYGIAVDLIGDTEIITSFLQPVQDAVGGIPIIGPLLMGLCSSAAKMILGLVMALTFPKLGGIPIATFAQYMSEIPGHLAEKAQMIESQIYGSRMGGGHMGGGGMRSGAGQTARAMTNQAFSNASKQAAAITASGVSAVGAVAGASLSSLGGAINQKADALEGKPDNPGVNGWDDMSPEQQTKAAEVAANTENWEDLDQDSRQRALEDAGVFSDGNAEAPGEAETANDTAEELPEGTPEEVAAATADAASETVDSDETQIPNAAIDDSVNQPPEMSSGGPDGSMHADPASNETKVENVTNAQGPTANTKQGDRVEAKSKLDNNVRQDANADVRNVDAGQHVDATQVNELGGDLKSDGPGAPGTMAGSSTPASLGGAQNTAQSTMADAKSAAGMNSIPVGQRDSGPDGQHGMGSSAHYSAVSQNVQNAGNVSQAVSMSGRTTVQSQNTDMSRSTDVSRSIDAKSDKQTSAGAQKAANAGAQSVNPSGYKSRYGKYMSVADQKKARTMHAVGDALQMMGGNRTMAQGMKEALGHVKDAAVTYATPVELQDSGFMTNLRMKRMERDRRNDQQNDKRGKGRR